MFWISNVCWQLCWSVWRRRFTISFHKRWIASLSMMGGWIGPLADRLPSSSQSSHGSLFSWVSGESIRSKTASYSSKPSSWNASVPAVGFVGVADGCFVIWACDGVSRRPVQGILCFLKRFAPVIWVASLGSKALLWWGFLVFFVFAVGFPVDRKY